jgi:hypothetical protein
VRPPDAPAQVSQQRAHFLVADVLERPDPLGAEELGGADLASLAEVRAVGSPQDVGVVVRGVLADGEPRRVAERRVVGLEEELGYLQGRADDDGHGPEPELHERAVEPGELAGGAVRQLAQQVEVADDWPWLGARWEVVGAAAAAGRDGFEDEGGGKHDGEERSPW